jgi:hypothetical protein
MLTTGDSAVSTPVALPSIAITLPIFVIKDVFHDAASVGGEGN